MLFDQSLPKHKGKDKVRANSIAGVVDGKLSEWMIPKK